MTVPSFPVAWRTYRRHLEDELGRRPRTVSAYRAALYDFDDFLGGKPWWKATAEDLKRYLNRRPHKAHHGRQYLAPATRAYYAGTVRVFYRYAYATGWLPRDPMAVVRPGPRGEPVPRALPLADVATILRAAGGDRRLECMAALAYFAALRAGEIARLQVQDVRLDPPARVLVDGKGGRRRTVPMHPELERIVRAYVGQRPRTGPLIEHLVRPGTQVAPGLVIRALGRHIHALGIDGSAHSLRHTAATELLRLSAGRDLETVRAFLGHEDVKATRRYVLAFAFDLTDAVCALPDPRAPHARP